MSMFLQFVVRTSLRIWPLIRSTLHTFLCFDFWTPTASVHVANASLCTYCHRTRSQNRKSPGQFGTCVFFFDCYRVYFTSLFFLSLVSIFLISLLLFHVNFMVWWVLFRKIKKKRKYNFWKNVLLLLTV
jgi:hypothetical protein